MKSLKGHFLVASPQLLDPNFAQTVVLLIQHGQEGALGLVLNRPTETTIRDAWKQIKGDECERDDSLYVGGPCQGVLMALHTQEEVSQLEVIPGLYFCTEADKIAYLVEQADAPARFFVGYAGWGPGQLENELETGSWMVVRASSEQVFSDDQHIWLQISRSVAWSAIAGQLSPKVIPEDPSSN